MEAFGEPPGNPRSPPGSNLELPGEVWLPWKWVGLLSGPKVKRFAPGGSRSAGFWDWAPTDLLSSLSASSPRVYFTGPIEDCPLPGGA